VVMANVWKSTLGFRHFCSSSKSRSIRKLIV
jgi:hypothetical protein